MGKRDALRTRTTRGLTLVELVVVLSILAVTTTVAVRSLGPIRERARFDATERALADLEIALLGELDAQTGFVADIGRLPLPPLADQSAVEAVFEPRELWVLPSTASDTQTTTMQQSAVHIASEDPAVAVATGWRGPYVTLPAGDASLRDGYGRPIVCRRKLAAVGGSLTYFALVSAGQDGVVGTSDAPGDDRTIVLLDLAAPTPVDRVFAELVVTITAVAPTGVSPLTVNVTVYGPDPTTGVARAWVPSPDTSTVGALPTSIVFPRTVGLTRGPKIVRAYVHTGPTSDPQSTPFASGPIACTLLPGGNALVVESTVPP